MSTGGASGSLEGGVFIFINGGEGEGEGEGEGGLLPSQSTVSIFIFLSSFLWDQCLLEFLLLFKPTRQWCLIYAR